MKKQISQHGFWRGVVVAAALSVAYQDWLGLERYVEHSRKYWVELPWWVGGLVAAATIVLQVRAERRARDADTADYVAILRRVRDQDTEAALHHAEGLRQAARSSPN